MVSGIGRGAYRAFAPGEGYPCGCSGAEEGEFHALTLYPRLPTDLLNLGVDEPYCTTWGGGRKTRKTSVGHNKREGVMGNHNENEDKQSFQVADKRRFDASGNERATSSQTQGGHPTSQEIAGNFKMESPAPQESTVTMTSFVISLATQAMVQMGQMSPPPGMDIPVDVESAKGTIDILAMLQQKTVGNLAPEEVKLMEDVLHSLRVAYLKRKS